VRKGRKTGIVSTWAEVQKLVNGFPGAQHKSFEVRLDIGGLASRIGGNADAARSSR